MKTVKIIGITLLLLIAFRSYSAVVVINQSGMSFSPSNVSVNVGDVIRWVWSGGDHTTTSTTIPVGAQSWDSPLTSSNTTFEYTVTVAGTYSYFCSIHGAGMSGSFTASGSSGVNELDLSKDFSIFPNPAKDFISIKTSDHGEILLSDVLGKSIKRNKLTELTLLDDSYRLELSDLASGIYIISFLPSNNKKRISIKFIKG